jgi:hypothetical protein
MDARLVAGDGITVDQEKLLFRIGAAKTSINMLRN